MKKINKTQAHVYGTDQLANINTYARLNSENET